MYLFERVEKYAVLFMRIFGKPNLETTGKPNQKTKVLTYWDEAHEVLERYKKEEKEYLEMVSEEIKMAKEFSRAKNKIAAIHCMRRKKVYEQQVEHLEKCRLLILDQLAMVTLATGVAMMKDMQKAAKIDGMIEQTEDSKLIQYALLTQLGSSADFDEDELEAELKELEGVDFEEQLPQLGTTATAAGCVSLQEALDAEWEEQEGAELVEQLLQPATTAPAALAYVPAGRQPTRPIAQKRTAEDEEFAASGGDGILKRKRLI